MLHAVADVRCQMERIMYAAIDIGCYGEVPAREHGEILEAIRCRDAHAARKLMYDHIVASKDKVLQRAPMDSEQGQYNDSWPVIGLR